MGPLHCFAMSAIVAKLSFSPYLPNSPHLPTFMGPLIALCFAMSAIVAKLSFSPYLPNSPLSPTFMGPLHCFVLCLVGDCGKIVIFAIFAKFAAFANFYGPPSLLCVFLRWRLWQNCHFRHICQICHFRQLLWAPFTALCFSSLAIVAKLSFSPYLPNSPLSPTFMGPLHCFVLCLVGDCGKIVIFAIFAKFAAFANFYGPPSLLCVFLRWRLWQNCHFRHICQICHFRQLLWAPFTALCFSSLAIVAKLSFSPYLPNSPLFANFYGPPSLLCVFPRWRLWQNCHFRHICQIHRFRQLLWAPFTALCFASLAIVAKLSFSPYLPNSPLSPTFMGPLHCFVLCLVGDCGKIVIIFAMFAKFAAFANFYGPPSLLCALPRWRLWQNCHFCYICQSRRFRQLLWASLAIVAKLSFSPYLPNSPLSPTFMGPLHCFVFFLVGDCCKIVIFAIFAKFVNIFSFLPFLLLCAFLDISQIRGEWIALPETTF